MEPLQRTYYRVPDDTLLKLASYLDHEGVTVCEVCKDIGFSPVFVCAECTCKNKTPATVIIESHIPMVIAIAKRLSTPVNYYDIVSVGMLALTRAVKILPKDIRNVSGYIRFTVVREIKQFILRDTTIMVPHTADPKYAWLRHTRNIDGDVPVPGNQSQVEIDELLTALPKDAVHKTVLRCLIEGGYSGKDIAEACKVTTARISQVKGELIMQILEVLKL